MRFSRLSEPNWRFNGAASVADTSAVVEKLDSLLDVSTKDRVPYVYAIADAFDVECFSLEEIGLVRELFSSARVAFGDEIVHDDRIDVTDIGVSVCIFMMSVHRVILKPTSSHSIRSLTSKVVFSPHYFLGEIPICLTSCEA